MFVVFTRAPRDYHLHAACCNNVAAAAAPSALAHLQSRRDSLQKRVDSLLKLRNEFSELSKVL